MVLFEADMCRVQSRGRELHRNKTQEDGTISETKDKGGVGAAFVIPQGARRAA